MPKKTLNRAEISEIIKSNAATLEQLNIGPEKSKDNLGKSKRNAPKINKSPDKEAKQDIEPKKELEGQETQSFNLQDILLNPKNQEEQSLQQSILTTFSQEEIELLKQDTTLTLDTLKQKVEDKQKEISPLQKIIEREKDAQIEAVAHGEAKNIVNKNAAMEDMVEDMVREALLDAQKKASLEQEEPDNSKSPEAPETDKAEPDAKVELEEIAQESKKPGLLKRIEDFILKSFGLAEKDQEKDVERSSKTKTTPKNEVQKSETPEVEHSVAKSGTIAEGAGLDTMRDVQVSYAEKSGAIEANSVEQSAEKGGKPSIGKFTDMVNKEALQTQNKTQNSSMQRSK